jgi:FKBP-type peptidyl-prolyl cis-trans isomerase 2
MKKNRNFPNRTLLFLAGIALLGGCAATRPPIVSRSLAPLTTGENVRVDYTCRLAGGALVATTRREVGEDAAQSRSTIFAPPSAYGPVAMEAGKETDCKPCDRDKRFFQVVLDESIQKQLPGLIPGTPAALRLVSDEVLMDEKNGTLLMRRRQSRPLRRPVQMDRLIELLGHTPEVGERVAFDRADAIPFKVAEIASYGATLEYEVQVGQPFHTPFGPARIESMSDQDFRIYITPEKGRLIRSGGLIGRVVDLDETNMSLDYRNPFGYEQLECEVNALVGADLGNDPKVSGQGKSDGR